MEEFCRRFAICRTASSNLRSVDRLHASKSLLARNYSIVVHSPSSLRVRSCSNSFVLFSTRLIGLARQFGAVRRVACASPRLRLYSTIISLKFFSGSENIFHPFV